MTPHNGTLKTSIEKCHAVADGMFWHADSTNPSSLTSWCKFLVQLHETTTPEMHTNTYKHTHTHTHTHTRTQTHSQTTRHDKKSQDFLGRPYTFTLAPQHVHLTNRSVQSSPTKAQHAMNIEIFWWTQGKGTRTTSRTQVHLLATLTSRKVWWKCIRKECLQCMAVKTISNHAFNLNNTLLRKVCPDICPTTLPCAWVYHKACPVAAIKLVLLVLMPDMTWIRWQAFM